MSEQNAWLASVELARSKLVRTISTRGVYEGIRFGSHDTLVEAETSATGKFLGLVAGSDVSTQDSVIDAFAGSKDAAGTVQTVDGLRQATRQLIAQSIAAEFDLGLRGALRIARRQNGHDTEQTEQAQK